MTETPLIRREVTTDRGIKRKHRHFVTISTEAVLACVRSMPEGWTTHDVAKRLGVGERAVRTAVQWLVDTRQIKSAGEVSRATNATKKPYRARVYVICPEPCQCDVSLLNRIFLLRT
jgi:hypothetical protein